MFFEFPIALILILVLPPLYWVLKRGEARTRKLAEVFGSKPPRQPFYLSKLIFVSLFIGSMTLVAARPYVETGRTGDFIFLVDASRSMHARHTCGDLTYLDRAKEIMRDVLADMPEARFSIVAYDRFAFPISQMTFDKVYLNEVIDDGLHVGMTFEATKTELANALSVVAQKKNRLPDSFGNVKHVILLSDGFVSGDYRRRMSEPLRELREAGIKVYAVGVGNPGETPIMESQRNQCLELPIEKDGQIVVITLRDDVLKFIAGETLGQYFAEGESDILVRELRGEMVANTAEEGGPGAAHRRDISWLFLGTGTFALFGVLALGTNIRM